MVSSVSVREAEGFERKMKSRNEAKELQRRKYYQVFYVCTQSFTFESVAIYIHGDGDTRSFFEKGEKQRVTRLGDLSPKRGALYSIYSIGTILQRSKFRYSLRIFCDWARACGDTPIYAGICVSADISVSVCIVHMCIYCTITPAKYCVFSS